MNNSENSEVHSAVLSFSSSIVSLLLLIFISALICCCVRTKFQKNNWYKRCSITAQKKFYTVLLTVYSILVKYRILV